MNVLSVDAPTSIVWGEPGAPPGRSSDETVTGGTRLVTGTRSRYRWLSPPIAFSLLVEFGDIWMMRMMLLNQRERNTGLR